MQIGWVGLGSIGTGMAKQALAAGHNVTVYARGRGLPELSAAGATSSDDYTAIAAQSDILGLCVYSDPQLREVLFAGALAAMRPGAILVIHTTGSPALAREIGALAPAGVSVIDATFSGGPVEVAAGTLTLITGGEAAAIERARPLIGTYGGTIHHVGPLGHGQMVKLLNNLLFASNVQSAAQILRMAEQQQLDTQLIARIIQDCSGASFAAKLFGGASIDAIDGITRPYLEKDVATALSSARQAGIDTTAFAATEAYFAKR